MTNNWYEFIYNIDIVWVQIGMLFLGIIFIIVGLFKPKDNSLAEEQIEKMFEDFILQIDVENEEILKRIKQAQNEYPTQFNQKLKQIEQRIDKLEQGINQPLSPPINQKYEEVLKLHQEGIDLDSIAKRTQMGHAEIKLILELSKKGFKYG